MTEWTTLIKSLMETPKLTVEERMSKASQAMVEKRKLDRDIKKGIVIQAIKSGFDTQPKIRAFTGMSKSHILKLLSELKEENAIRHHPDSDPMRRTLFWEVV